ncbi:uncharacterized protein LOC134519889 isoform X2 [Chroicocephalus ridibundus]|uniref:uncharacterized protein LOC134519889 isoform X2 n=1 Tax=Chroicocephalus ridibundus TaxID=1192867 RepID=UPI002FDEE81C
MCGIYCAAQEGVLEETRCMAAVVVVNYPVSRWDGGVTVTAVAGEAEPQGGQCHGPAHTQHQASDGKEKAFTPPDPSSLQKLERRAGSSLGKPSMHLTYFFPPVFSRFPRLSRVLLPRRVRKPTDGTVLFLEEPGLAGGQARDAGALEKRGAPGKFLPTQGHRQSLPWPFVHPELPKARRKMGVCTQNGLYATSGRYPLPGKGMRNHPANRASVRKTQIPMENISRPASSMAGAGGSDPSVLCRCPAEEIHCGELILFWPETQSSVGAWLDQLVALIWSLNLAPGGGGSCGSGPGGIRVPSSGGMQRWPPGPEPSPSPRSLRGRARHRRRGGLDPAAAFQIAQVKLGFAQKRLVSAVQSRDAGSRSVVMLPQREALPFSSSGHSFPKPRRSQTRGEEGAGTASLQGGFGEDRDLCHASSIHAPANRVVSEQDSALTGVVRNVTGSHGRCKPDSRHLLAVPRRRSAYESACENIGPISSEALDFATCSEASQDAFGGV